ncbi:MAG: nucleotide-binding protein [Parasphingorhabdus sp.]|uniref:nucleotide-binding protein n=1 Tax=Parasphingorhabdus sp. TaxID=2709688 RepID=UPI0030014440
MKKPNLFIGSAGESLDLAYAAQEGLERDLQVTVWTQGVFQLSRSTMESLIDVLNEADFGLFVLSPNDVTKMRNSEVLTVRDNVIFELGLFIGRLGRDRCYMLVPRGIEDLHLPTDLLGITPAEFDAEREDQNLAAALGPACQRILRSARKLGHFEPLPPANAEEEVNASGLLSDPHDCTSAIQAWMGSRPSGLNTGLIRFHDTDRELGLTPGSTELYIEAAAKEWGYSMERRGPQTILFNSRSRGLGGY